MPSPRVLTLMGSGETAPTMVSTHRRLAARLEPSPGRVRTNVRAAVLDTPYGFQENASELAERAVAYFSESIDVDLDVAGLTRIIGVDDLTVERGLEVLRRSDYIFAGPGSPTYAVEQWRGSAVPGALRSKLEQGGVVVFASAAALTLGVATVPVYEIYKCGHEPFWADGLDLLAGIGIEAAVIPHYDNAEGGHHDTRFCYLGERRLTHMETMLPEGTWVLGIDEHTGLVIDLDAGQAEVTGNGGVTLRVDGESLHHPTGSILDLAILTDRDAVSRTIRGDASTVRATEIADDHASDLATIPASAEQTVESSLADTADRADREFSAAITAGDAATATGVMLELETAIWAWSADTLQSDETDRARQVLRSMVTRLGEAAVAGLADPRAVVAPLVDLLLQLRSDARAEKRFEVSDLIRDRLDETGVEVRDTADGAEWDLRA
ncbi:MAG: hypothetical protein ACPGT2_08760 [Ilumatobacteraceae bacterium]